MINSKVGANVNSLNVSAQKKQLLLPREISEEVLEL